MRADLVLLVWIGWAIFTAVRLEDDWGSIGGWELMALVDFALQAIVLPGMIVLVLRWWHRSRKPRDEGAALVGRMMSHLEARVEQWMRDEATEADMANFAVMAFTGIHRHGLPADKATGIAAVVAYGVATGGASSGPGAKALIEKEKQALRDDPKLLRKLLADKTWGTLPALREEFAPRPPAPLLSLSPDELLVALVQRARAAKPQRESLGTEQNEDIPDDFLPAPTDPVWHRVTFANAGAYQRWITRMIDEGGLRNIYVASAEASAVLARLANIAKEEDGLSPALLLILAYQYVYADKMFRQCYPVRWVTEMVNRPFWAPSPEDVIALVEESFFGGQRLDLAS